MKRIVVIALGAAWCLGLTSAAPPRRTVDVAPNDNTHPAGTLSSGVLSLALEIRPGTWHPEGPGGRSLDSVAAFAESGHDGTTPGPLIRVPVGTDVRGTLHNTLGLPLTVIGLGRSRALSDSLIVGAGATIPFDFRASAPGTYIYSAHSRIDPAKGRAAGESQLNGVIVVDGPNPPPDRILAISWYFTGDSTSPTGVGVGVMTINGLGWPHTERLTYAQGDSVHWRVVNLTEGDHPMHLHGFYFRVDSRSGGGIDTIYSPAQRRMAVTEMVEPFSAVELAWQADRPGNWIFHCHYATHVSAFVTLDTRHGVLDTMAKLRHPSDRPHQMYGLVTGITITPRGPAVVAAEPSRRIRIEQREKAGVYGTQPGLAYLISDTRPADSAALPIPGPILVLERGKRVEVTLVNASDQHAAIHWHGIELESSYPDGVPGWSGAGAELYPPIAPHDSLTVRWTPRRAGSFMYHSHFNESQQMGGGLYGPIIVLEPGQTYDPERDRTFFFGTAGAILSFLVPPPTVLLNGSAHPAPMTLHAGTRYRFRFFNLAGDSPTYVTLLHRGQPVRWRAIAKDGYPLPAAQAVTHPATLTFDPGEIYDFEYRAPAAGEYSLAFGYPQPSAPSAQVPPLVHVAVHVR